MKQYQNRNLHLSKIQILFPVSLINEYKVNADYMAATIAKLPKSEFTPQKLDIFFQFVSETIGVEPTTFPSHMQNFVKPIKNC